MNPESPGSGTSENKGVESTKKWIRIAAGLVVAVATALLGAGVIPADSAWIAVLTMLVSVGGAIGGEASVTNRYTHARTALKLAKLDSENPPQP